MSEREWTFHRTVAQDFLPKILPPDATWCTYPLGETDYDAGAKYKVLGARRGWPDLQLVRRCGRNLPGGARCEAAQFCAIELKVAGRKPSEMQLDCHDLIARAGGKVGVAWRLADIEAHLRAWGFHMPFDIRYFAASPYAFQIVPRFPLARR